MKYQLRKRARMMVIGIDITTTFKDSQHRLDIKELWEQFFQKSIQSKIPNQVTGKVLNIYHQYNNQLKGGVSVLVGYEVSSLEDIPNGLLGFTFPAASEAIFLFRGKLPKVVYDGWDEINKTTGFKRTFDVDYDIYDLGNLNPDQCEIEIHTSVDSRDPQL